MLPVREVQSLSVVSSTDILRSSGRFQSESVVVRVRILFAINKFLSLFCGEGCNVVKNVSALIRSKLVLDWRYYKGGGLQKW